MRRALVVLVVIAACHKRAPQPAAKRADAGPACAKGHDLMSVETPEAIYRACEAACLAGDAQACDDISGAYTTEPERALPFAQKGCDLGNAEACNALGVAHSMGSPRDCPKAIETFKRACAMGSDFGVHQRTARLRGREGPMSFRGLVIAGARAMPARARTGLTWRCGEARRWRLRALGFSARGRWSWFWLGGPSAGWGSPSGAFFAPGLRVGCGESQRRGLTSGRGKSSDGWVTGSAEGA